MNKWPNFFIVGVEKAGTTSLYEYLKQIPQIYFPVLKEPWYFASVVSKLNPQVPRIKNDEEYLKLFSSVKNEKAIGEATAVYWRDPEAPILIHEKIPNAKIIISLRDPVERTFSGYLMGLRDGLTKKSFSEQVNFRTQTHFFEKVSNSNIGTSFLYYDNIKRFIDIFGKENVKILIFEEWIKNPLPMVNELLQFLDINTQIKKLNMQAHNVYKEHLVRNGLISQIIQGKINNRFTKFLFSSKSPKLIDKKTEETPNLKPIMNKHEKEILIEFFREDVKKLENLLQRKFPWPNFK